MATTSEGKVKKKIQKLLSNRGAWSHCPMTHGYGHSGVHDVVAIYKGYFLSIEAKATAKDKPTMLQNKSARDVIHAGGSVLLIHKDNVDLLDKTLDSLDKYAKVSNPIMQIVEWPVELNNLGEVEN